MQYIPKTSLLFYDIPYFTLFSSTLCSSFFSSFLSFLTFFFSLPFPVDSLMNHLKVRCRYWDSIPKYFQHLPKIKMFSYITTLLSLLQKLTLIFISSATKQYSKFSSCPQNVLWLFSEPVGLPWWWLRIHATQEMQVQPLGQENLLKKEMTSYSCILIYRIPWTKKLGRLQSMWGRKEVRRDLVAK